MGVAGAAYIGTVFSCLAIDVFPPLEESQGPPGAGREETAGSKLGERMGGWNLWTKEHGQSLYPQVSRLCTGRPSKERLGRYEPR